MDVRTNPLKLSSRFVSYLEKHRIYELFQELSMMLIIKKPDDHVLFLKQSIYPAFRRLDAPRVLIFAPPGCDQLQIAGTIREKLQVPLIRLGDFADADTGISCALRNLKALLMHYMDSNIDGWILIDYPRSEEEARYFQRSGIIPSHVIEIGSETFKLKSNSDTRKSTYHKEIRGIRRVYSNLLNIVAIKNNSIENTIEECLTLFDQRNYKRTPTTLRTLILDFADAERYKCLGPQIAEAFNILYIDFNNILEQVSLHNTEQGDKMRRLKEHTCLKNTPTDLKIEIFEKFLLNSEGLFRGWLLAGFVNSLEDLKKLDLTDYPPNRIIIIVSEENKNEQSDKEPTLTNSTERSDTSSGTYITLQNCVCKEDMDEIINYVGKTAKIIEDHGDFKKIKEQIQSYLMLPPPCVPPRIPKASKKIKPEEIEFDPDDEPNPKIFDYIRNPEPMLPLI